MHSLAALLFLDQTVPQPFLTCLINRSVPTKDDILVPETLLKKRKSQEKDREAVAAEREKKKAVGDKHISHGTGWQLVMIPTIQRD